MMRQNIFENTKRQTPKMTFVYILKVYQIDILFWLMCIDSQKYNSRDLILQHSYLFPTYLSIKKDK